MRIPRSYTDDTLEAGHHIQLDKRTFQHVVKVLRLREGNELILFNGKGGEFSATLTEVDKKQATVFIRESIETTRESSLRTHLVLGISRGERMDFAIQKAVELGVSEISPVYTEHCVVNLDDKREKKRLQHWQGIVISACEQCGRNQLPQVNAPQVLVHSLPKMKNEVLRLILNPYASQNIKQLSNVENSVLLLIGPEGGLSEQEVALAIQHGFHSVQMGPRILRTETAAISAISALQVLWGDL